MTTLAAPSQQTRALPVLSLLWRGRLSWMRIVLGVLYGERTYELVETWRVEVPAHESQGWMLALVPQGVSDLLVSHPSAVAAVVVVLVLWIVVGLATRPALLALVAIGLFARSLEVSQGVFDHESSLTTQVLVVLAFAPGTNVVSLEHYLRWRREGRTEPWGWLTAPYRPWGVFLVLGLLAITYTASGLSKLRFGGLAWIDGETLGFYLRGLTASDTVYVVGDGSATWRDDFGLQMYTYGNYAYGGYEPAALGGLVDWMAHTPAVMIALSAGTVLLELCGFLLFVPRLRSVLLVGYIGMHTSIGVLMGLPFVEYQVICLLLIEWERIVPFVARRLRPRRAGSSPDVSARPPVLHG